MSQISNKQLHSRLTGLFIDSLPPTVNSHVLARKVLRSQFISPYKLFM